VWRAPTTISCRAFALSTLLIVSLAVSAGAADRPPPPKLPLAQWWSIDLGAPASAGPVADASRVYVALKTAELAAFDAADGHERWRIKKDISTPMVVAGELLYVASGDAIEAIRGDTHATAWVRSPLKTGVPLVTHAGFVFVITESDLVALRLESGEIAWQFPGGGVKLPPAFDGDRVYVGADDGRLVALNVNDGTQLWERFLPGGITALAAYKGRVYVGGGDKVLHCLDGQKKGAEKWPKKLDGQAVGHIAVDDERVYVASRDNVVSALDRQNGNQRWQEGLRQRPTGGTYVSGHIVFVPVTGTDLVMFYDAAGAQGTSLNLPGEAPPGLVPDVHDSADGPIVYAVSGSLTNEWSLTKFAPAADTVLLAFSSLMPLPGVPYLTDPQLMSLGAVLRTLVYGDPPLIPAWQLGWPIMLTDPPLVPLTILPGAQLRLLSPVLPARRGGSGPAV
jgi:outer membrane protein assembly factor BamB